ncbi:MAG: hypothetical protein M0Q15_12035 [Nevskia sp.]|nr:hypothetical protein [Nevskia sp.]
MDAGSIPATSTKLKGSDHFRALFLARNPTPRRVLALDDRVSGFLLCIDGVESLVQMPRITCAPERRITEADGDFGPRTGK